MKNKFYFKQKDERGDTSVVVTLIGFTLCLLVFASILYVTERTFTQTWSKSVTRSVASTTALICENYQANIYAGCIYVNDDFIDNTAECSDITGGQSSLAWQCEWDLTEDPLPDYIATGLQLYYSPRVAPQRMYLEARGDINQVYVRVVACSKISIPPLQRWCGTAESYQYI